ncbi:O-antigen ligase family protein [Saccharothrix sp. AJ9571]|nr:O-antigen ligase family protein [Saccharothrix sp. AJ9571]
MNDAGTGARLLRVLACSTVALAPVEGYLIAAHPHLAKVPVVLLAAVWAVVRFRARQAPVPHPVHVVLLVLTATVLAAAAVHVAEPFALAYTLRWLPFVLTTVILIDLVSREVPIRALLAAAVAGAVVAGGGALYSLVVEGKTRASGPMTDPNDLSYVLVAAVPLVVALVSEEQRRGRAVAVLAAVVLIAGAAATFSRGGGLALLAAAVWLVARRAVPVRVLAGVGAVVLGLGAVAAWFSGTELARASSEKAFIAQSNVDTRELRWQVAARMLADSPVFGTGPGGFRSEYTPVSRLAEIGEQTPVAHNMYLEVGAELGLPGLLAFFGVLAVAGLATERALRHGADRRLVVPLQASLLAVLVASLFLSQQYYLALWFVVALACAADLMTRRRETVEHARPARDQ